MRDGKAEDIDGYIAMAPRAAQKLLRQLRKAIHQAAPKAEECISYGMPAFKQGRVLVYFALWEKHIGFYPTSSGIAAFKKDLSPFKSSKGAVQFPLDSPLPLALVTRIVKFRVQETQTRARAARSKAKGGAPAGVSASRG